MRDGIVNAVDTNAEQGVAETGQGLERRSVQEGRSPTACVAPPARVSEHLHT